MGAPGAVERSRPERSLALWNVGAVLALAWRDLKC